ncbi:type II toxin-antitoxin system prevent-host-death family antitoxin [Candidatus Roizmanbacteria bacterium]|nr:type II toxin-antitoxin system prevent-host-death family antitoxin [Candidatus Roizmanbacteria bacterium]
MLIPTSKNVKTITDMREDALGLLELVKKQGVTYIFHRSKPKAVMIDVDEFARIQELLEDYFDTQEAIKLEKEPKDKRIPIEEVMKEYV